LLLCPPCSANIGDWVRDGDYIYVDDEKAYLNATYSITHGQPIEHSVMTKQYSGDCDMAIGFDGEVAWPTKVLLEDPHYVYWDTDASKTFYYVSNFAPTTDPQDYGNSYNPMKYKFDHKIFIGDNIDQNESAWGDVYGTVAYFDSQVNDGTNYTITWNTEYSQLEQYRDISNRILSNPIEYDFDNKNLWFVTKDISMTAGEMKKIIIEMDGKIELGENSYKYDIIWKPSYQTISEAKTAGNLYVLDPYLNTSWNNRISNQLPDGARPYLYSLNISNDVGTNNATHVFGNGKFNSNYSDLVMAFSDGTIIPHAIEDNSSDPTVLWANVTSNGTVYIYYNNSDAVDTSDFSGIASGGVVSGSNGKIIHSFLSNGTFSPFTSFDVDYLVIAGGGAGAGSSTGYTGGRAGGGGGAGGFRTDTGHAVSSQAYSITVGAGGDGTYGGTAEDFTGDDSVFDTITSLGGGRGGFAGGGGGDGGSGGGAGRNSADGGDGTVGQGNDGGGGAISTILDAGAGGGGGKGATGQTGTTSYGGDGGDGIQSSLTGSAIYYGGGGGGARYNGNGGTGGLGGGADGRSNPGDGYHATPNTGGGGGGAVTRYEGNKNGGDGGSGIVIISYNERGTWVSWSSEEHLVDSLHYNVTSPYNHTIESDGNITSNRSITASDDTNDTAQSTGISYLTLNVYNNSAKTVRNFTFYGNNLDWYQVENITGSYNMMNSTGIIQTVSDGNFTTNLTAGNYWIVAAATTTSYTVSGTIYGAAGLGEGQVTVTLGSDSTTTSSSGAYSFSSVSTGTYTLTVSKPGLQDASTTITVSGDTTQDLTMTLAVSPAGGGQQSSDWLPFNISGPISRIDGLFTSHQAPSDPGKTLLFWSCIFGFGLFMFIDGTTFHFDESRNNPVIKLKYVISAPISMIIMFLGLLYLGMIQWKSVFFIQTFDWLVKSSFSVVSSIMGVVSHLRSNVSIPLGMASPLWSNVSILLGEGILLLGILVLMDGLAFCVDKSRENTFLKIKYQVLITAGIGLSVLGATISQLIIFS